MAELQELVDQHRRDLLALERRAASRMVRAYGDAWRRLRAQVLRLQTEVERRRASGEPITLGSIYRLERMREIQGQIAQEIQRLSQSTNEQVTDLQRLAVQDAILHAQTLTRAAVAAGPHGAVGQVMIGFHVLPHSAVEALVGAASNGGPLADLIQEAVGGAAESFVNAMAAGIAAGQHPSVIARTLRDEFGMGLTRALVISRTETLRAYRSASLAAYQENDEILKGWIWSAQLDETTCITCWLMNGTEHELDDVLDGHPNCRCAMVPLTKDWDELGFPGIEDTKPEIVPGQDAFEAAGEEVQEAVLGTAAYNAWKDGQVKLTDFLARSHSERWGTMRYTRSLKAIREGRGGRWNGPAVLKGKPNDVPVGGDVRMKGAVPNPGA